jgi:hypothetical protein
MLAGIPPRFVSGTDIALEERVAIAAAMMKRSEHMSMTSGNPPVGVGYGFDHEDPAEPGEERHSHQQDKQDRVGTQDRELPDVPMSAEERVEEIVVREQGVNSFANAEKVDRMVRPPSVNDRDQNVDKGGNLISNTVKSAWDATENPESRTKDR